MVNNASFVLKVLQGRGIDDLVRESIQNSLDASTERTNPQHTVTVDFTLIDGLSTESIAGLFDDTTKMRLEPRFGKTQSKLLAIRDTGTTGLTGEWDDEKSNIYKLLRNIGLPKELVKDAGGSWGLGKTIYFGMGPGIVGYYSKIGNEGNSSERLVFTCIEDETKTPEEERITESEAGIAWWLDKNQKPLSDPRMIAKILKVFRIEPFKNNETGTVILIPFFGQLRDQTLLPAETSSRLPFECTENLYIKNAIQRWYCNRLTASDEKCLLKTKINGNVIPTNHYQPVFKVLQKLKALLNEQIKSGLTRTGVDIKYSTNEDDLRFEIDDGASKSIGRIRPITINQAIEDTAPVGYLAAVRLSERDLGMREGSNKMSPHKYIFGNNEEIDERSAILGMCRSPEMIVAYDKTGEWTNGLKTEHDSEFVIALFILNSKAKLVSGGGSLEEYVRSTEDPTHRSWTDKDGRTIISATKTNVKRALMDTFAPKAESYVTSDAGEAMRAQFGKALLPDDFGTAGTSSTGIKDPPKDRTRVTRGSQPKLKINFNDITHKEESISIKLGINTSTTNDSQPLRLSVLADAGSQKYNREKWVGDDELKEVSFPFKIMGLNITKHKKKIGVKIHHDHACFTFLEEGIKDFEVELSLQTHDRTFKPVLELATIETKERSENPA